VGINDKTAVRAWIYLYTGPIERHRRIPFGGYIAFLNHSYASF
jgi:hypothetical protein